MREDADFPGRDVEHVAAQGRVVRGGQLEREVVDDDGMIGRSVGQAADAVQLPLFRQVYRLAGGQFVHRAEGDAVLVGVDDDHVPAFGRNQDQFLLVAQIGQTVAEVDDELVRLRPESRRIQGDVRADDVGVLHPHRRVARLLEPASAQGVFQFRLRPDGTLAHGLRVGNVLDPAAAPRQIDGDRRWGQGVGLGRGQPDRGRVDDDHEVDGVVFQAGDGRAAVGPVENRLARAEEVRADDDGVGIRIHVRSRIERRLVGHGGRVAPAVDPGVSEDAIAAVQLAVFVGSLVFQGGEGVVDEAGQFLAGLALSDAQFRKVGLVQGSFAVREGEIELRIVNGRIVLPVPIFPVGGVFTVAHGQIGVDGFLGGGFSRGAGQVHVVPQVQQFLCRPGVLLVGPVGVADGAVRNQGYVAGPGFEPHEVQVAADFLDMDIAVGHAGQAGTR
ncbi:hypothetical protein DSECCO2_581760 [anaerobic digester metagenome]